ncbi:MAG TPA: nitroreductase family protein [Deltaproteobacteria bacterium]|nr:nitroreductase family protein [Deltaproteobacteria bacterium]
MLSYDRPVRELIRARKSWRSFTGESLSRAIQKKIEERISTMGPSPFGSKLRFALIEAGVEGRKSVRGTYGVIRGATHFLAGTVQKGDMAFEDFGYAFESLILFATSLGLGTCWLGGTLNRSMFGKSMEVKNNELMPAISPVGHAAHRRSIVDSFFYLSAGSKNRKPWKTLFFLNDFSTPLSDAKAGEYAVPLEMVRLAPSAVNRQPWRIVSRDGAFHFYLCRSGGHVSLFKEVDLQRIDMGIAMFHFHSSALESGLKGAWQIIDPGISPLPLKTSYQVSWIPGT